MDEFQHIIYENPDMTTAERNAAWRNLEKQYLPHRNYEGNAFLESGGFWQKQSHIFNSPFYYIDYTLAQICAFEAIGVGIDKGGEKRMTELNAWPNERLGAAEGEQYLGFVVDVVRPYIDLHYRTEPGPANTAIIGSSMGGLASHHALHTRRDVFGLAGVLSPAYWVAPQIFDEVSAKPLPAVARVYLYAGGKEGAEMTTDARRMHELLAKTTAPDHLLLHIVDTAEHNEAAWRAEFPAVVVWLFGLKTIGLQRAE